MSAISGPKLTEEPKPTTKWIAVNAATFGVEVLQRFVRRENFPPLVYFGTADDEKQAAALGPDAHFMRDHISHDSLIVGLSDVLRANERIASTT